ncbi:hypothetical protein [Streptomyces sp. NPDC002587]
MDEGAAAIWAAGIGVGGVVITAGMGWYAARKAAAATLKGAQETAAAQVEAALAGVRAQLSGQHHAALWQVRREAYATFLGQIEAVRMAIAHMGGLCAVAIDNLGGAGGPDPDLTGAKNALTDSFKTLWFRESALRLAVDPTEAEQAEALMKLARKAISHVDDLVDAIFTHGDVTPPERRLEASMRELRAGIEEWATNARQNLESADQES